MLRVWFIGPGEINQMVSASYRTVQAFLSYCLMAPRPALSGYRMFR